MEELNKGSKTVYKVSPKSDRIVTVKRKPEDQIKTIDVDPADITDIKTESEKSVSVSNKETTRERKVFPIASVGEKTFVAKKEVKKPISVSRKGSFINSIKENSIALKNSKLEINNDFLKKQIEELKTTTSLHNEKANLANQVREIRLQDAKNKKTLAKTNIQDSAKIGAVQTATAFNSVKDKAVKGGLKVVENTTELTGSVIEGIADISSTAIKAGSETLKGASKLSSEAVKTTGKVVKGALKMSAATVDAAGNIVEGVSEIGSSAIKATGNVLKAGAVKASTLGDYVSVGAAKSVAKSKMTKQTLKGKADAQTLTDEQKHRIYESSLEGHKRLTETVVNKKIAKNKAKIQKEISKNISKKQDAERLELKNRQKDAGVKSSLARQQRRTATKEVVAERQEKRTEIKKLKAQTKIDEINVKYDAKKSQIEKDNARKVELLNKQKNQKEEAKQGQHILDVKKIDNKSSRKESAIKNKSDIESKMHEIKLNLNNLKGESLVSALNFVKNNIQNLEKNITLSNEISEQKQTNKLNLIDKKYEEKNEILQTKFKAEGLQLETDLIKEKTSADKKLLKAKIQNEEAELKHDTKINELNIAIKQLEGKSAQVKGEEKVKLIQATNELKRIKEDIKVNTEIANEKEKLLNASSEKGLSERLILRNQINQEEAKALEEIYARQDEYYEKMVKSKIISDKMLNDIKYLALEDAQKEQLNKLITKYDKLQYTRKTKEELSEKEREFNVEAHKFVVDGVKNIKTKAMDKALTLMNTKNKEVISQNVGEQIVFNPASTKEENQGKIGSAILFELKTIINNLKAFKEENKNNIIKAENIQRVSLALQGFSDILKAQKNDQDFIETIKNFGKCGDENQITNPELKLIYEMLKELGLFKIDEIYQEYCANNNTVIMNEFIKNQDDALDKTTIRVLDNGDYEFNDDYEDEIVEDYYLDENQENKNQENKILKESQMEN